MEKKIASLKYTAFILLFDGIAFSCACANACNIYTSMNKPLNSMPAFCPYTCEQTESGIPEGRAKVKAVARSDCNRIWCAKMVPGISLTVNSALPHTSQVTPLKH